MSRREPLPWSIWVLALDVIGAMLVAFGIIGLVGGVVPDWVEPGRVRALSIASIVIGALLTLPFVVTVVRQAMGSRKPR